MRVTVIGCSGSFAGPASPASSYLISAEASGRSYHVLLDLGSGALGALQRHLDPHSLDALFLTHLHPDHCIDVTGLYVHRRYHPGGSPAERLPVYGPQGSSARLAAAYEGLDERRLGRQFDFRELADGFVAEVGPLRITARRVNHPIEAYGFRVEGDGAVVAYSGDTDDCPALVDLARDADLFLVDSAFVEGRDLPRGVHLTGRRAAEVAVAAGADRLMLTHLPSWNDPEVCRAQAAEVWPGVVELAVPDATYDLWGDSRRQPSAG
jgi:ribonuclease BN (tRNA processing enzyme)